MSIAANGLELICDCLNSLLVWQLHFWESSSKNKKYRSYAELNSTTVTLLLLTAELMHSEMAQNFKSLLHVVQNTGHSATSFLIDLQFYN
jgi:hypothetical protein